MVRFFLFISAIIVLLSASGAAYAYLDPGTGSSLLQGLFAGIAGVLAILKLYWQRVKNFFSAKKKTKDDDTNKKE